MRIVSLLPSATEIVCSLGLLDQLVGITHACDYPPEVAGKRVVTRSRLAIEGLSSRAIDDAVRATQDQGEGVYELDLGALAELAPSLVLTQGLCEVCAVSHGVVQATVPKLRCQPKVLSFSPRFLADVLSDIKTVGDFTKQQPGARALMSRLRSQVDQVALRAAAARRLPRVLCLEWLDPPWTAGHWIPEMVGLAGGLDGLATAGSPSRRTTWPDIAEYAPEAIVLMPCGFDLRRTQQEASQVTWPAAWYELPAVRAGAVWTVDGSGYFNRPGPRLFRGLEILAALLQPELFDPCLPTEAALCTTAVLPGRSSTNG